MAIVTALAGAGTRVMFGVNHWISIKTVVKREISEDDPAEGQRVTDQLDRIWVKYTGNEPPYGLRDPSFDERRVLFEMEVVGVATFGRP